MPDSKTTVPAQRKVVRLCKQVVQLNAQVHLPPAPPESSKLGHVKAVTMQLEDLARPPMYCTDYDGQQLTTHNMGCMRALYYAAVVHLKEQDFIVQQGHVYWYWCHKSTQFQPAYVLTISVYGGGRIR